MRRFTAFLLAALLIAVPFAGVSETLEETDQLVLSGSYSEALAALDRILAEQPDHDEAYGMKLRLRLMALKDSYDALNEMIAQDSGKVRDPGAYTGLAKSLYEEMGLALVIAFKPDYQTESDINNDGSTPENLTGTLWMDARRGDGSFVSGVFAAQGDWVYFVNPQDNYSLWKMRSGGGSLQRVLKEAAGSLNVSGDYLYFRALDENNALYRVRTDGSEKTLITPDSCLNLFYKGGWIFYENASEGSALYQIKADGSERFNLNKKGTLHFIQGDGLYYSSPDMKTLKCLDIWTGKEVVLVKNQWHLAPRLLEGSLYAVMDRKGMVLQKMDPDGKGWTELLRIDGKAYCYAVKDGHLALSVRLPEGEKILNYGMDTMKDPLVLMEDSTEALCVDARGVLYALNQDGLYVLDLVNNTARKVE